MRLSKDQYEIYDQIVKHKSKHIQSLQQHAPTETDLSLEIKACSETEKIWIMFDIDNSGQLEYDEVRKYLHVMAFPALELTDEQTK